MYVLRAFDDTDVPGSADPLEHLRVLEIELTLADLESVEKNLEKKRKTARLTNDRDGMAEVAALDAAREALEAEDTPIYRSDVSAEHREILRPTFLLTNKPVLAIVNVGEDQLDDVGGRGRSGRGRARRPRRGVRRDRSSSRPRRPSSNPTNGPRCSTDSVSAKERCPGSSGRPITALGLRTFFTTGEKESPGVDLPRRVQGAPRRRVASTPTSSEASSAPR